MQLGKCYADTHRSRPVRCTAWMACFYSSSQHCRRQHLLTHTTPVHAVHHCNAHAHTTLRVWYRLKPPFGIPNREIRVHTPCSSSHFDGARESHVQALTVHACSSSHVQALTVHASRRVPAGAQQCQSRISGSPSLTKSPSCRSLCCTSHHDFLPARQGLWPKDSTRSLGWTTSSWTKGSTTRTS